jgi:L-2-hydroxyglutarate oxidase LhgO
MRAGALYPSDLPRTRSWKLGIHLTFDLGGHARFEPDVEWVDHLDYGVDPARVDVSTP